MTNDGHPDYAAMDAVIRRFRRSKSHRNCPRLLKEAMAAGGAEITVSTLRPLVRGPYTTDPHICPHGTYYWIEPTGEQIARWVATQTP
jgi:hypothetical protein